MANCTILFAYLSFLPDFPCSKPPTQTPKFKTLQKMTLSYFHNLIHIFSQLTDNELLQLAVTESAKIIPYIMSNRKAVKLYLKVLVLVLNESCFSIISQKCLELWSSANDSIRIASFVAIRKLASITDQSILDHVLKVNICPSFLILQSLNLFGREHI